MAIRNIYSILPCAFLFLLSLFCVSTTTAQIDTALLRTIKNCDMDALQQRLKLTTDINAIDSNGANALMWGVYYCDVPIVKYLVEKGAKVPDSAVIYFNDEESPSPFYGNIQSIAADKGKLKLLQYIADSLRLSLNERGFNPISGKKDEHVPLLWALSRERMDIVSYLLQRNKEKTGGRADHFIRTSMEWSKPNLDKDIHQRVALQDFIIEVAKEYFGEEQIDYARALSRVGYFYWAIDQYHKGLVLYEQAFSILKKNQVGENQLHQPLNNLAVFYYLSGKYDKALPLYEEALNIFKRLHGEHNRDYALYLMNTASVYAGMGQYDRAVPLLQKSLSINKGLSGEEHPDYVRNLSTLANIYSRMGLFDKALPLHNRALSIRKKMFGEENINYAHSLHGVAYTYVEMGLYDHALSLFNQAIAIYTKDLGEDDPNYAGVLHNLGALYSRMGQYDKSLPLTEKASFVRKKRLGELHPDYATTLNNLALAYWHTGKPDKAEPLFEQAMAIREKTIGKEHPEYARSLNDLSAYYISSNKNTLALPFLIKANEIELNYLIRTYSTLSELEKIKLLINRASEFFYLPSFVVKGSLSDPTAIKQLYQNELVLKGIALQSQQEVIKSIRTSSNPVVTQLYEEWKSNLQFTAKQMLLPINKRVSYLDSLQEATNLQEQDLSRHSAVFRNQQHIKSISVKDVAKRLLKDEAAIEFLRFGLHKQKKTDSVLYAALLLLPNDSVPKFIYLFEEKQLEKLLHSSIKEVTAFNAIQNIYTVKQNNDSTEKNELYALVWKPLEKYLDGIKTINYSPTGLLHRISFSALPVNSTQFLIDKYHLNQLLSTRTVATNTTLSKNLHSATVWGNIKYNLDKNILSNATTRGLNEIDSLAFYFNPYTFTTLTRGTGWRPLPATKAEIDSIKKIFARSHIATTTFSGDLATEEVFKKLSGKSPQVLHLATHGFFLPISNITSKNNEKGFTNTFSMQQNPMFRSGLVLAGGDNTWKKEHTYFEKEDGILTAFELAQMDLSQTELVVLSACETALGDLQGNEGVIGLQRALKMAGVKQMILSLWQVPDKATMQLMTQFYKNCLSGKSTREALRSAQLTLKKKYSSPYFWAAFVLVE